MGYILDTHGADKNSMRPHRQNGGGSGVLNIPFHVFSFGPTRNKGSQIIIEVFSTSQLPVLHMMACQAGRIKGLHFSRWCTMLQDQPNDRQWNNILLIMECMFDLVYLVNTCTFTLCTMGYIDHGCVEVVFKRSAILVHKLLVHHAVGVCILCLQTYKLS